SAESAEASRWLLPAGPWREGWDALERADAIVVTRKHAPPEAAEALARRLAERRPRTPVCVAGLTLDCLEGMQSGTRHGLVRIAGLAVRWERNGAALEQALDAVLVRVPR